ncbi:MAG: hypothetical protein HDR30_01670 [Lachnospiraceae bacterium]|nr:hypothetical protein [Lachnospiraceae bacterium]
MKSHRFPEKYKNCIIAMLTIIVNLVLLSICFDFYYDLNDDVMIKDIMAGVYTGTPDGHNMQTLYILGAFISLCYKLCRPLAWYGLFLLFCQMGSLYLIGVRLLKLCQSHLAKAGSMLFLSMFTWGIILPHIMAVQYTFTCAMLAGAAVFLFLTTPEDLSVKQFVICNIPSMVLVVLAYQLRTEMLLLVFPFIGLAGLFRWTEEKQFFQKENYCKYGIVLGCILIGMLFSRVIDFAAYGSSEWQNFLVFFEKRTQVYDFHPDVITSGEHKDFLTSIGLSGMEQELLANYNFGLSEKIDEKILSEIAAYASSDTDYFSDIPKHCKFYLYRTLHETDAPYNRLVVFAYLCLAFISVYAICTDRRDKKKISVLWKLLLLGIVRTCLWMFILIRGRDPERITHSLYLVETMVLAGMLCKNISFRKNSAPIIAALCGLLCVCYLPRQLTQVSAEQERREEVNRDNAAIAQYCRAHPDNFYFEDVYSTVEFSEKMFRDVDNSLANYDIMGGWMCKSPLYREKLEKFGIVTMEESLLSADNVYFIMETGEPDVSTDWLRAYYREKGIAVSIEAVESIGDGYKVYRIERGE